MTSDFWRQRILVTGSSGFLGSYVMDGLVKRGANYSAPRHMDWDLRDARQIHAMILTYRPDVIIHLAAVVGGIGANREHPAEFLYDNLMMGAQLIHLAWQFGVKKFVTVGTVCAYPKFTPAPFKEEDLWNGYPEETNAPYGLAKKMLLVQGQAYRQQYGFNSIYLLPTNLYGPGDNFREDSSHVIPALIRRYVEANEAALPSVEAWGDGSPTREFLHATDAAEGILLAAERYDGVEPVNLGSGDEISIRDLSEQISNAVGYSGITHWDATKPNGQPRRVLDTSKAAQLFGFKARMPFEQGLRGTIDWYVRNKAGRLETARGTANALPQLAGR